MVYFKFRENSGAEFREYLFSRLQKNLEQKCIEFRDFVRVFWISRQRLRSKGGDIQRSG